MGKKKLIYIISSIGVGGAEVALLSALEHLNNEFDFRLVCLRDYNKELTKDLSSKAQNNIVIFKGFILNFLNAFFFILHFKPDIVISSLWKGATLAISVKIFKPTIKYIEFVHSTYFFHFFDKFFTKLAIKLSDIVFCDSYSTKIFVQNHLTSNKPIVVISFLRFESPAEWKEKKTLRLRAIYLGRFHEIKRIDNLVYFVKQLIKNGLPFELDLYGPDDGTLEQVKKMVYQHKLESDVMFKGPIATKHVQEIFQNYDFYFQTSSAEGMSMSVVEAMQHGLICVVTNVGEIKNYAQDGKNALLLGVENFEEEATQMVLRIKEILSDIKMANEISKNAYLQFVHSPQFAESLVKEIQKI